MNKYFNMNEVPIGTKVKIIDNDLIGEIVEIFHFPTTFKIRFEDNSFQVYKTHEVELFDNPGSIEENE